jgi:Na+-transporting methylmalonyl-CoA/oxaloacetate decarboxylase beta subunit
VRTEATSSGIVPVVLLVLLVGLLLAALGARGRRRRVAAVLLLPVSAGWVLFNGPIEGPILLTLSSNHGLTVSDLLAAVGVLVAGVVLLGGDG